MGSCPILNTLPAIEVDESILFTSPSNIANEYNKTISNFDNLLIESFITYLVLFLLLIFCFSFYHHS